MKLLTCVHCMTQYFSIDEGMNSPIDTSTIFIHTRITREHLYKNRIAYAGWTLFFVNWISLSVDLIVFQLGRCHYYWTHLPVAVVFCFAADLFIKR